MEKYELPVEDDEDDYDQDGFDADDAAAALIAEE